MISFIRNLYYYSRLIFLLRKLNSNNFIITEEFIDTIIYFIQKCGCVTTKLCQWICTKLELLIEEEGLTQYEHFLEKLEIFYENCPIHSLQYTHQEYQKVFSKNLRDDYEIIKVLGSGSIGQTYLLKDYKTQNLFVMKIRHPYIKKQFRFFKFMYHFSNCFGILRNVKSKFPFHINNFINNFEEQIDFIKESNNLLMFVNMYKSNDYIIIPELLKCSESVLIMTYEEGVSLNSLDSHYKKNKLCLLLDTFIKNNNITYDFSHGDIHKGNWKVRDDKLIIYDFGYCFELKENRQLIELIINTFENLENATKEIFGQIIYNLIDNNQSIDNIHEKIRIFVNSIWDNIGTTFSPIRLYKIIVKFCNRERIVLKHTCIQSLIVTIQVELLFRKYNIKSSDEKKISSYDLYRNNYLDLLAMLNTYNICPEYREFIETKLNHLQVPVTNMFDTLSIEDELPDIYKSALSEEPSSEEPSSEEPLSEQP